MTSVTIPAGRRRPGRNPLRAFFGIVGRGQTYRDLLYLLLAPLISLLYLYLFNLGGFYFPTIIEIPVIVLLALPLAIVERGLAQTLLGVRFTPLSQPLPPNATTWERFAAYLSNPVTWKSLVYLVSRVLFGLLTLLLLEALVVITFGCIFSPILGLFYYTPGVSDQNSAYLSGIYIPPGAASFLNPVTMFMRLVAEALTIINDLAWYIGPALVPVGILLFFLSLHIVHGVAQGWGWYARVMLGINPKDVELAKAHAATDAASARAERSEDRRRQLILDASHELRTPVATIRAHIDSLLLLESANLPEHVVNYLAITQHEVERLGALVDDLLVLARSDSEELHLTLGPVVVADIVDEVFRAMEPLAAHEWQITLVRQVAEHLPDAQADRERLAQVILNLVRNAITYTPAGGIVSLDVAPAAEPSMLAITVTDTGIGIADDDLPHIFERFYRTDASRARHSGGFGLGLSISRDLIQAMGGDITAERVPAGGSRFIVTLPAVDLSPNLLAPRR